jgi:hypothetical protein
MYSKAPASWHPALVWGVSLADGKGRLSAADCVSDNHVLLFGSALAEQFDLAHASHAIST